MTVTLPYTFTPQTIADANQVNSNFQAVANGVNASLPTTGGTLSGNLFVNGGLTAEGTTNLQGASTFINGDLYCGGASGPVSPIHAQTAPGTDNYITLTSGSAGWFFGARGSDNLFYFFDYATNSGALWIHGTTRAVTTGADLTVSGIPYAYQASFTLISDPRVKEDVADYHAGLSEILALNPITFRYNGLCGTPQDGEERKRYGLDAAQARAVAPELVGQKTEKLHPEDAAESELLTLDSGPLIYMLMNSVKELAARVGALEAAVAR
jgi:hypothetical protein